VDTRAQDAAPDRFAGGIADARAEAAADDQHEDRSERPGDRTRNLDVVEHRLCGNGAKKHSGQKPEVLSQREPEPAAKAVREADNCGGNDGQID